MILNFSKTIFLQPIHNLEISKAASETSSRENTHLKYPF